MVEKSVRELCLKRILHAIFCNIVVQAVLMIVYLLLFNVDIFNPLQWLGSWFSSLFSLYTWLYFFPVMFVIFAQGALFSRDYITLQPYYRSRFSFFVQMFSFHSQRVAFLHIFIGFLIPWVYLSVNSGKVYNRFVYSCSNGLIELQCFSEERLYLILACVMANIYYLLDNFFLGSRHLTFPVIQMPKFFQIKSQFSGMIKDAVPYALVPNAIYMALYYLFGGSLRDFITGTFALHYDNLIPLDTLQGLFSIKRLFYLYFLTGTTVASMKLVEMLFKVHLTERYIFPLSQSIVEGNSEIVLKDALQCKSYPIIQHLGFLDLFTITQNSVQKRAEIYKLSVPGGHPHMWKSLKNECLKVIEEFTDEASALLVTEIRAKQPAFYQKPNLPHEQPSYKLPGMMKKNTYLRVSENLSQWYLEKTQWFSNLPIIIYFFGELKEIRIRFALRNSLMVMWSAHSLSYLACFSLTEDNYGIVQNDLSQVITVLLNLKQVLDSLDRYFIYSYKVPRSLASYQKANYLRKSVKRSIYRIANAFQPYITDLQLSKDVESKMMAFVNYKE